MYYFDHSTTAMSDTKLMALCLDYGCGAVAAYWVILELIYREETALVFGNNPVGSNLGSNDVTKVVSHLLNVGYEQVQTWVSAMLELGLLARDKNNPDAVTSTRAMDNIERYHEKAETARQNGKKGGRKPTQKPSGFPTENQGGFDAETELVAIKQNKIKQNKTKRKGEGGGASATFHAPTVDEVRDYCTEKGYTIDPERFCDYYGAQGWKLSNGNPMKSWRQAANNWARDDKERRAAKDAEDKQYEAYDHVW